ncbi:MAG TPA: hypothetical protein VHF67_00475, partial [Gaiellaceae bacterium]|nr:hypothetical protein [Gaiellaceae bacterium]
MSDSAGTVVAVWREVAREGAFIRASTRSSDGEWSPSERLSAAAAQLEAPEIAMDRGGNAVAVWHTWVGGRSAVFAALRRGGTWGAAEEISAPGEASFAASVDVQAGRAIVVWAAVEGGFSVIRS